MKKYIYIVALVHCLLACNAYASGSVDKTSVEKTYVEKNKNGRKKSSKNFPCKKGCDRKFSDNSHLNEHYAINHYEGKDKVICGIGDCTVSCSSNRGLTNHKKIYHEGVKQKLLCEKGCDLEFDCAARQNRHYESCHYEGEGKVECDIEGCSVSCKDRFALGRHRTVAHGGGKRKPKCEKGCDHTFLSHNERQKHYDSCHYEGQDKVMCGIDGCSVSCKSYPSLANHQKQRHEVQMQNKPKRQRFACEKGCVYFVDGVDALKQHHESCHYEGEDKLVCGISGCVVSCKSKRSLANHQKERHKEQVAEQKFLCEKGCNREFGDSTKQNAHYRICHYEGEDKVMCGIDGCPVSCKDVYSLRTHKVKMHKQSTNAAKGSGVGKRKRHAGIPCKKGCEHTFVDRRALNKHYEMCHYEGDDQIRCGIENCSVSCKTLNSLKIHRGYRHSGMSRTSPSEKIGEPSAISNDQDLDLMDTGAQQPVLQKNKMKVLAEALATASASSSAANDNHSAALHKSTVNAALKAKYAQKRQATIAATGMAWAISSKLQANAQKPIPVLVQNQIAILRKKWQSKKQGGLRLSKKRTLAPSNQVEIVAGAVASASASGSGSHKTQHQAAAVSESSEIQAHFGIKKVKHNSGGAIANSAARDKIPSANMEAQAAFVWEMLDFTAIPNGTKAL